MSSLRTYLLAAVTVVLAACSIEVPTAPAGPCGGEGQRCCQPEEARAMGLPTSGCGAGRICTTAARATAMDAGVDAGAAGDAGAGMDAATSSRAVCRACPASDPDVCGNACVNLRTDTRNCGRCGTLCAGGEVCMSSSAPGDAGVRDGGASGAVAFCQQMCPAGQDFCPGRGCSNRMTDPNNCGACGNACMAGQSCTGGRCICAGAGNLSYCSAINRCVDLMTDNTNCGACGTMCPAGQSCTAGRCSCSNAALAFCPMLNRCVDLQTDPTNCGACGTMCPTGQACTRGMCACSNAALSFCPALNRCVDLQTDPTNCGMCGNMCPTGQACTAGRCACPGTGGLSYCSAINRCVDLQTDPTNCGTCGTSCPAGQSCAMGRCSCPGTGFTFCAGMVNRCVDLQTDPANCGMCGTACRPGESCTMGRCVCPGTGTGFCTAINRCTDLQNDQTNCGTCGRACNLGESCRAGTCTCPITGQSFCAGTGCTNLMADINNCGMCGRRCPEGQVCGGGTCRCPTGLTLCGSSCVDLTSNNTNCSACSVNCETTFANGLGACIMSRCTQTACRLGFGDCDRSTTNGCEVNLMTESANCGTCGNRCRFANAVALCSGGLCTMGACNTGFADCNMNPIDGCETDVRSDTNNCGTCSMRCTAPAGRTPICVASSCTVGGTCAAPLADCNGAGGDGCEVNTNTDVANCGSCGRVCNATNGAPMCSGGVCVSIACNAGFGNCDGNVSNGCEVDHRTSVNHCGSCGNRCVFPNATSSCVSSTCTLGTCSSGFGNCDGDASNGCETGLASSNTHCGACGRGCTGGQLCVSGTCTCPTGQVSCSGTCVNTATDNNNCGGCGTVCAAGTRCSGGSCTTTCLAPTVDCSASGAGCVNTMTSTSHCGGCGMPCSSTGGTPSCASGTCSIVCSTGFGNCDSNARNGCEPLNTATNCGTCGTACNTGRVANSTAVSCSTGACRPTACATGFRLSADMMSCEAICGGNGEPVCAGSTCNAGFTPNPTTSGPVRCAPCSGNLQLACATGTACGTGLTSCGATSGTPPVSINVCYDLQTADENCGMCGNRCMGMTPNCVAGVCVM
ncbi:MAG: hypothetical protein U0324_18980 [Polyangiales bacterium]